ncbi:CYTH domain-containing protein [Arthrobacter sp. Leaf69]|uniref:CYTH domain-containing protein n=1 Tax=Arthrobacter sp. Leaf69 TaxID=1736232 RepID=UPI0006FF6ED2|nr:CYTH domain-containing protein [Arthrobacter sp. Leaf69]KQN86585.1 hypothetical protein ASE96_13550 [Arthrobacter sp. Leaf69]
MAATRVVEIERKFDVEEEALLPSPRDLPGVARVDRPVEHRLEAEYFDTEDLRLASAQITLRRRTGGEDAGWHLKLPAGPDERTEFREPLGEQADSIPDTLRGLVRVHTRDRALVPVLRRLGAEAFVLGENGFSYGRLHALEQSAALEAEARFHREWKKFPSVPL